MRLFILAIGWLSQWSWLAQLQETVTEHDVPMQLLRHFLRVFRLCLFLEISMEHAYKQQLIPQMLQCQETWHKAGKCNKGKLILVKLFASKLRVIQVG